MSILDDWFPDAWASAEAARIDETSLFSGWLPLAVVSSASMFFVTPRASADVQSGVILVPVVGMLLLKPRLDRAWSHGRAGSVDGQRRVANAFVVLSVCIGLAAALVRSFGLTVTLEPTMVDVVGFLWLCASLVGTGLAGLVALLPGGEPTSIAPALRRAKNVAVVVSVGVLACGALAYVRRDVAFDHYLSNLPELARLPWPAMGEPWQTVGALREQQVGYAGPIRVCASGHRVAVVRLPGAPCAEVRGGLVGGTGEIVLRQDTSGNALFVQLQGAEPWAAVAFVGDKARHLSAVPHDWLGPRRPPGRWVGLAAVGVVVALAGAARGARARRQASAPARWRAGSVSNRGAFVFDDGGGAVPLPAGTKVEPGPAVWVTLSPSRDATYRSPAEVGDARIVSGTTGDLQRSIDEADATRDATAVAVLAMTSAPLLAALCIG